MMHGQRNIKLDVTKLKVVFHNFVGLPKNRWDDQIFGIKMKDSCECK
jgi:hypothetical protein